MIGRTNSSSGSGGVSYDRKPAITFNGKWSGWHVEFYEGLPYWEALFSSSGTLTSSAAYACDAWGIGGGGAGGYYSNSYSGGMGTGGGSGYTNLAAGLTIAAGSVAVTIGAGGNASTSYSVNTSNEYYQGSTGGNTTFLTLTCAGGQGGSTSNRTAAGNGGSNGGSGQTNGGANGSPGAGKIMSKFQSSEHNTEYGAGGVCNGTWSSARGGGGGGYYDVGGADSLSGHGYGAGGGGRSSTSYSYHTDWYGRSGCLIIRIPI